jgi:hypothetical protein
VWGGGGRPAPAPGAAPAAPRELYAPGRAAHYAFLNDPVAVHARASGRSHVVGRLRLRTQDGTDEVVGVLASRGAWLRVQLPLRPAGRTGWIPRASVGELRVTDLWLRVNRRQLRATLVRNGQTLWTAPIGIGTKTNPTPAGRFYVRDRIVPLHAGGRYGPVAFGTSARSATLTDWPGGGFVGVHGTNQPGLIPGRISHGCVRLRNADVVALDQLLEVGTPVTIS